MKKYLAIMILFLIIPVQAATDSSIDSAVQGALKDLNNSATKASGPQPWDSQTTFPKLN